MTEIALDNFINFATDHTEFLNLQTPAESLYLIDNSEFTNTLNNWLNNHNNEFGAKLGRTSLQYAIQYGKPNFIREYFIDYSNVYTIHVYLLNSYPSYQNENIDIQLFILEHGVKAYLGVAEMYDLFKQELDKLPSMEYQWQLAMEEFRDIVIGVMGLVPGIGDLVSAYDNFSKGAIFWGCFDLAGVLFPNELFKVVRNASNIKDAWKGAKAFWTVWQKIGNLPGSQKVWNKMPQAWKDLDGGKLANNMKGLNWKIDAHNEFRIMEAVANNHILNKRVPYTVLKKNGQFLGINNKFLYKANGKFYEDGVEISLSQYEEWSHIPNSQLTDLLLDNFFN